MDGVIFMEFGERWDSKDKSHTKWDVHCRRLEVGNTLLFATAKGRPHRLPPKKNRYLWCRFFLIDNANSYLKDLRPEKVCHPERAKASRRIFTSRFRCSVGKCKDSSTSLPTVASLRMTASGRHPGLCFFNSSRRDTTTINCQCKSRVEIAKSS